LLPAQMPELYFRLGLYKSFNSFPVASGGHRRWEEAPQGENFQFFPSCFILYDPSHTWAPASTDLSILSQLLPRSSTSATLPAGTSAPCSPFQFFPSCFAGPIPGVYGDLRSRAAFNSFPVASRGQHVR